MSRSILLIVLRNGIISVLMAIFTILTMHGYKNAISFGDPENCMDPFPYIVRDVDLGLSMPGWIFNLVDGYVSKCGVAPVAVLRLAQ